MRATLMRLLLAAAVLWHALTLAEHYRSCAHDRTGRDFASYYYAAQVAAQGGDPYDKRALGAAAADEATRKAVHPFFYPPPFLLTMTWALPLDLSTAYRLWFWLDELFAIACGLVLWRWWRGLSESVGPVLVLSGALLTAIPNNHLMGQANFPVLLLVLGGLWAAEQRRDLLGGALVGAACMMKMSPALFVAWWLLHRQWRPAAIACASAVVYSALTLPLLGPTLQVSFYTDVLPTFSSGSYNGLGVGIDLFGNHALPNLYDDWFPAGGPHLVLSSTARALTSATLLAVVGFTGWVLRERPVDALGRAAHVGAIAAAMLLVPVITYEHHLIWLLPSAVAAVVALEQGRLDARWAAPVGLALAAWCFDLVPLKSVWTALGGGPLALAVRELKMGAILVLYAACLQVARGRT